MIRPHVRLGPVQYAGWEPTVRSAPRHRVRLDPGIAVPLPDGTVLRADIYRPDAPGRFPALLAWSSYTRQLQHTGLPLPINEVGVGGHIVSRGYAHLTVNARGTGGSGGERIFPFSAQEQGDVADAIEWAAAQPWCDGNVGMAGMSYFAVIQYLVAARRPPHLRAIFPYLGWTDLYRHAMYHGGAVQSDFLSFYLSLVGATQHLSVPPAVRHLLDHRWLQRMGTRAFLPLRPLLARRLRPEEGWMRDFVAVAFDQRYDGPLYRQRSAGPALDCIEVPVCLGPHWGNPGLHMRGAFEAWARLRSPTRLFIGPPEAAWPWASYQGEMLAWYDHHLKGIDNGVDRLPPVRYWLQGAGVWRTAEDWPLPGAATRRLFLSPCSQTALHPHALRTEPPAGEVPLSILAVPRGMLYPREMERYEAQVLRYATEPFPADTEVVGPLRLHLRLVCSAPDTHVIARLGDLAPDGRRRSLAFGWLQASHRRLCAALSRPDEIVHDHRIPEALVPGTPVDMDLSLTPTARRGGHRRPRAMAAGGRDTGEHHEGTIAVRIRACDLCRCRVLPRRDPSPTPLDALRTGQGVVPRPNLSACRNRYADGFAGQVWRTAPDRGEGHGHACSGDRGSHDLFQCANRSDA